MDRSRRSVRLLVLPVAVTILLGLPGAAFAKAHLWRFSEFFSNAGGSIQFVEMQECCGGSAELNVTTWDVSSIANGNTYHFPHNLTGDSAYQHLLLATQSFANLPGAPTPDFIIPPQFFDPQGDALVYGAVDAVTIPSGAMPLNGTDSIDRSLAVQTNDPTNFAGTTGSVVAPASVPALPPLAVGGLLVLLATAGALRSRRAAQATR